MNLDEITKKLEQLRLVLMTYDPIVDLESKKWLAYINAELISSMQKLTYVKLKETTTNV